MADTGASSSRWRGLLPAAALAAVTAWTYAPVRHGGWLWDDNLYVTHNPLLRSAAGLKQIWLNPTGVNYFPVTATCQWLQWHLWQDRPLGYHLTNVALHLLSAFLLWRLLRRLGSEPAWIGAWLFALHPLAVESVAWISELKNTLSLPLLLLAMAAYVDYDDASGARPGPAGWSRPAGRYGLALLWFLAAMLSKSTVAMFPVVVLLYGWWRRGHLRG